MLLPLVVAPLTEFRPMAFVPSTFTVEFAITIEAEPFIGSSATPITNSILPVPTAVLLFLGLSVVNV
jgi:hypothetical protein